MAPFLQYALFLLIAAIVIPLVAGAIGRVFFFSRDEDDPKHPRNRK